MLELLARHALFDIDVKVAGDLHVDQHHSAEDCGIALGQAFAKALGDKRGVKTIDGWLIAAISAWSFSRRTDQGAPVIEGMS
ncbi:hypothetical protein [Mangrovicoccus ximenensis]|uniref:hypothetical protein n=1 Tax=Mangrovicoccus ximenensis TaxID=1911570 RepID=UPI00191C6BC8